MARDRDSEFVERSADVVVATAPVPVRVLDVGCGDGARLREIAVRVPYCEAYVGVDAEADLDRVARGSDGRMRWARALPAALPFAAGSFDLVVADDAAAGWDDAPAAIRELARVLGPHGTVVLVERAAAGRRGAGSAGKLIDRCVTEAGLTVRRREDVARFGFSAPMVRAAIITP